MASGTSSTCEIYVQRSASQRSRASITRRLAHGGERYILHGSGGPERQANGLIQVRENKEIATLSSALIFHVLVPEPVLAIIGCAFFTEYVNGSKRINAFAKQVGAEMVPMLEQLQLFPSFVVGGATAFALFSPTKT
jgi:hypothetical protein